jgi:hypothetical protein
MHARRQAGQKPGCQHYLVDESFRPKRLDQQGDSA